MLSVFSRKARLSVALGVNPLFCSVVRCGDLHPSRAKCLQTGACARVKTSQAADPASVDVGNASDQAKEIDLAETARFSSSIVTVAQNWVALHRRDLATPPSDL